MKKIIFCWIVLGFIICGCASQSKRAQMHQNPDTATNFFRIFEANRFKEGGGLLMIPFKAGPGVEASNELDRIALMMVKGLSEVIQEDKTPFVLADPKNPQTIKLILEGRVIRLDEPSRMKRWIPGKDMTTMAVEGYIVENETEKIVARFLYTEEFGPDVKDYSEIGYAIGKKLGVDILGNSKNKREVNL